MKNILAHLKNISGDLRWTGRSGVPGLGVSVAASRHYGPALRQWDEAAAGEAEAAAEASGGKQPGLGARLVRLLNLRRRNTVKLPPSAAAASSEARAAVRRSQSLVTAGNRVKLGQARAAASAGPRHADSDRHVYCDDARPEPGPVSGAGGYICQRCEVARPGLGKTTSPVSVPRPSVKRSVSCHQARLGRREAKKRSGQQPDPAPAPGGAATTKVVPVL